MKGAARQQIDSADTWTCDHAESGPNFTCRSDKGAEFRVFPAS